METKNNLNGSATYVRPTCKFVEIQAMGSLLAGSYGDEGQAGRILIWEEYVDEF